MGSRDRGAGQGDFETVAEERHTRGVVEVGLHEVTRTDTCREDGTVEGTDFRGVV